MVFSYICYESQTPSFLRYVLCIQPLRFWSFLVNFIKMGNLKFMLNKTLRNFFFKFRGTKNFMKFLLWFFICRYIILSGVVVHLLLVEAHYCCENSLWWNLYISFTFMFSYINSEVLKFSYYQKDIFRITSNFNNSSSVQKFL